MIIVENMIKEAKAILKGLKENKVHSKPCDCILCLFYIYRKKPRDKLGRPFGKLTFFLNWLVYKVKVSYLIDSGKAKKTFIFGKDAWELKPGDYEKAPYIKKTKKILEELYKDSETEDDIKDLAHLLDYLHVYKWRTEQPNFHKLLDELAKERWQEWIKTQPQSQLKKKWNKSMEQFRFVRRVADYIYVQPKKQISKHKLLRHFSAKREEDLNEIKNWLFHNHRIYIKKRGKSIIYIGGGKSSKGIYFSAPTKRL